MTDMAFAAILRSLEETGGSAIKDCLNKKTKPPYLPYGKKKALL